MNNETDITLGDFLRNEREARGITIEQVASATKVGVRILHSLEADQFAELPAKPFVLGFVTSYCRFIGLDPKEILARFEDFMENKLGERPNRDGGHSGYAFEKKDSEQQSRTILLLAMFSFIVVGGIAMLLLKPSLRHRRSSHIDRLRAAHEEAGVIAHLGDANKSVQPPLSTTPSSISTSTSASAPEASLPVSVSAASEVPRSRSSQQITVSSASDSPETDETDESESSEGNDTDSPPTSTASEPKAKAEPVAGSDTKDPLDSGLSLATSDIHHKLSFKILEDLWVRYRVDDRPVRTFIIRKGHSLVLRATRLVQVQFSNPNAVKFHYNGGPTISIDDSKNGIVKQGVTTLVFPVELAENIDNPIATQRPLPTYVKPKEDNSNQVPVPSP
jgi:cytoskeletal protein RodZ